MIYCHSNILRRVQEFQQNKGCVIFILNPSMSQRLSSFVSSFVMDMDKSYWMRALGRNHKTGVYSKGSTMQLNCRYYFSSLFSGFGLMQMSGPNAVFLCTPNLSVIMPSSIFAGFEHRTMEWWQSHWGRERFLGNRCNGGLQSSDGVEVSAVLLYSVHRRKLPTQPGENVGRAIPPGTRPEL